MKKEEFLKELMDSLTMLAPADKQQLHDYYEELFCDKLEQGLAEDEIIAGFGSPKDAAARINEEYTQYGQIDTSLPAANSNDQDYTSSTPIKTIIVEAENIRINVVAVPSGPVRVLFEPREGCDTVHFSCNNGVFLFQHTMRSFFIWNWKHLLRGAWTLTLEVPANFGGELCIKTTNASISASNLTNLSRSQFVSSNSGIRLENLKSTSLLTQTSNSRIELTNLIGSSLDAISTNGRLTAFSCAFTDRLLMSTSNSPIEVHHLISNDIVLKTSNAPVTGSISGDLREYAIASHTTNGSNNLPNYNYPDQPKHLCVKSSNGRIKIDFTR